MPHVTREAAAVEAPRALAWTGASVLLLSFASWRFEALVVDVMHLTTATLMLGSAWAVSRWDVPHRVVPWVVATAATLFGLSLVAEVVAHPTQAGLGFIVLVLVGFGPFTLDAVAFAAGAIVLSVGYAVALASVETDRWSWSILGAAAVIVGALLLRLRLTSIRRLVSATALAERLADHDRLTGLLTRHGLDSRMEHLSAAARRRREHVVLSFVDVDGMKAVNDRYGHPAGDRVLCRVGQALTAAVRAEDLVCRWGGDEFLVVGAGSSATHADLEERVRAGLAADGARLGDVAVTVTVGTASQAPTQMALHDLIAAADQHMYRRRERRALQ